jgi:predicted RNA-binding protein with PUA-like domain
MYRLKSIMESMREETMFQPHEYFYNPKIKQKSPSWDFLGNLY